MASTKQSVLRRSWVAHVGDSDWRLAFGYAVPVVGFVLGLFYQWFALANRCVIFLYGHMRARPFDRRTISRYWMAGLVASGMVMVLYAFWNWLLGRVASWHEVFDYHPSEWWRVWLICALSVAVGILVITTTVNQPTLPADVAVWCVLATLIGLALALAPGRGLRSALANCSGSLGPGRVLSPSSCCCGWWRYPLENCRAARGRMRLLWGVSRSA